MQVSNLSSTSLNVSENNLKNCSIKIASLNVRTLVPNIDEIRHIMKSQNILVMCLNETRLDHSVSDAEICVDNYNVIRKDRNRQGGGTAIYISKFLSYTVLNDLSLDNFEHILLKVKPPHQNAFLLCSIYRPPSTNKAYYFDRLVNNIENAFSYNLELMMLGDLNENCSDDLYNDNNHIYKLCQLFNMAQLVIIIIITVVSIINN